MSRRLFGTDGVRGVANVKLTPELAFKVGQAAGRYLLAQGWAPRVVMGRDTRRSGPMLGAALAAGYCSAGVDVLSLGVIPTGGISFVARTGEYGMGAVISASHNPATDNGIKLIGHDGRKLPDAAEREIEGLMESELPERPEGAKVGDLVTSRDEVDRYLQYLLGIVEERLDGLTVAVDAADGAASELAPELFRRLGAKVCVVNGSPDGMNINARGGATKPGVIQKVTPESGADLGIAFDGDADRAVFSDEQGRLINGDRTMAMWCAHWRKYGVLEPAAVVGTVMSNGGFEQYMASQGIKFERTPVGDKHVAARLTEIGGRVGGEQSGHIIFTERGVTGDGLITALEVLRVMKREGRAASAFYGDFENWPQVLVNISVSKREGWDAQPEIQAALRQADADLAGHGRVVVRPSGTQPMIRVMVEADAYDLRDRATDQIVEAFQKALSGKVYSRVDLTHALGD